jgi:hypothetical protein
VVVIAAGGNERRLRAITLGQFETENVAIEAKRALEVGHLQMDVADASAGIDRCRHSSVAASLCEARGSHRCRAKRRVAHRATATEEAFI